MSDTVQENWPSEVREMVQSPLSILLERAGELTQRTKGQLVGEVTPREREDDRVELQFDMVVPDLQNYRHRIMTVSHRPLLPYPAVIDAELFRSGVLGSLQLFIEHQMIVGGEGKKPANRADSDEEFLDLVKKVLYSSHVRSVSQSLILRVAEERKRVATPATP